MLGGDGAVLDNEDSIEIVTAKDKGNFKEIIEYIDNQIREIILGGNLTGQVTGGSQAAATVHNGIREDLAQADENIINKTIKELITFFKEINNLTEDITGNLKNKDNPNKELADRDKVISDMGYTPKKDYIEKTYNIVVEDLVPKNQNTQTTTHANKLLSFSKLSQDELEHQAKKINTNKILTFQEQIINTISNANSYEEAFDNLVKLYPNINTKDLEQSLFDNIANSSILGAAEIEEENPNG